MYFSPFVADGSFRKIARARIFNRERFLRTRINSLCADTQIVSINTPFGARRCRCPVMVMTDDRHYDLSITIVPGITAPRKLQLIANIDCPRRRNCPPPGVTHNVSAPKICRGQPGAKTDSPGNVVAAGTRRPREHTRPIISQHCQF